MQRRTLLIWLLALMLFLAACGGSESSGTEPPASTAEDDVSTVTETEDTPTSADESADAVEEEPAESEEEAAEEEMEEEPPTEEPVEESEPEPAVEEDSPWGDRPLSGTDPETGLVVNPPQVNPGDTVIIRGEIISMNLTPTTSPEFLIRSPEGVNYRIRSQDLQETTYEDGTEIPPHLYQKGMLAQATISLPADANPLADLASSEDLFILNME